MINTNVDRLGFLARLVLTLALLLFVVGVAWHGVTLETFQRIWIDLIERPDGPMSFRFILQPLMAVIAAILDGRRDARRSRSPYFLTVLRNREERIGRLREGLNATARIILLGIIMDVIYQLIGTQDILSGRGSHHRCGACLRPIRVPPRHQRAHRAPVVVPRRRRA